jgi:hypothetical protein
VIDSAFESSAQSARVFGCDAGNQHALLAGEELGGYFHDLRWRLACAEDDLGEASP